MNNGQYLVISANIVPVISGSVQRKALRFYDSQNIDHLLKSLDIADTIPTETESSEIELQIGNDYYLDIILSLKIEIQPGLYLLASKLGWILTGRTNECESSADKTNMLILTYVRKTYNNWVLADFVYHDGSTLVKSSVRWGNRKVLGGRTRISVTECIVIIQAHDAHIICKVKTYFVALHVNYKKKKKTICQFEGMKLDHRNYLDLNEKTCLQGYRPCKTQTNLECWNIACSKFINYTFLGANNKGADQTARMCGMVCAFDVCMHLRQVFSRHGP